MAIPLFHLDCQGDPIHPGYYVTYVYKDGEEADLGQVVEVYSTKLLVYWGAHDTFTHPPERLRVVRGTELTWRLLNNTTL